MSRLKRIALLIGEDLSYGRRMLRGIHQYARPHRPWVFRTAFPTSSSLAPLAEWNPAGIIVQLHHREMLPALLALGKPIINVSSVHPDIALPRVANDDAATGEMAARYFLERGYTHLAYCGPNNQSADSLRLHGFCSEIDRIGLTPYTFQYTPALPFQDSASWMTEDVTVRRWLQRLPKPVGIFAFNDLGALRLSEVCQQAGLHIPDDVAIIGVDNDEVKCLMAYPPLSSIDLAGERIGSEAARTLDRLLSGSPAPEHPVLIPPIRLVTRESSDRFAQHDQVVAAAVRYIREHAHQAINVDDVLTAVPIGRRALEKRFRATLHRSVLQEIRRHRVDAIKNLLVKSDLSINAIATEVGFTSPKYLMHYFKQETGQTVQQYRRG